MVKIRKAAIADAPEIVSLINFWAERGRMLHRSLESVYNSLREFHVAQEEGQIIGCVAVDIFWADLAEVKSLAVSRDARGKGLGSKLVKAAMADARRVGVKKLFALTYEKAFFLKAGFLVIDRDTLPEKVWRECIYCPKVDKCDEIAMMRSFERKTPKSPVTTSHRKRPHKGK
jgi:amino-acid N-acetyltransferase